MFFKICDAYAKFLSFLLMLMGLTLLFSVSLQVAGRYIWFIPPYLWTLEVTNFALIWGVFVGSIIGMREGKHFFVDVFQYKGKVINPTLNFYLRVLYYVILASIIIVFTYYGWLYFLNWGVIQTSDITGVNLGWLYVSVPFAGVSWFLYFIEGIIREFFLGHTPRREETTLS